jgi:hypothetical protein
MFKVVSCYDSPDSWLEFDQVRCRPGRLDEVVDALHAFIVEFERQQKSPCRWFAVVAWNVDG